MQRASNIKVTGEPMKTNATERKGNLIISANEFFSLNKR